MKPRSRPGLAVIAALAFAYFVAGKGGLTLAFVHPSATAVWPPTGIALAALLVLGYGAWPGIFLGAFFVNVTTAGTVATSLGLALGNTLEGLVGAYLVNRFAGGRRAFDRARDILKFAVLAGLGSTMVSATIGVTSLCLTGFASWASFKSIWTTWWLGDVAGDLVVAPAVLLWWLFPRWKWKREKLLEGAALTVCLAVVGAVVFSGLLPSVTRHSPLEFLCVPILLWAAYRFGSREAATATVLLSAIAVAGTLSGLGPFAREDENESLLLLQAFTGVAALTTLILAAAVSERKRVEQSLSLLESAVENAVEGVVILASDGPRLEPRILFVNGGFTRLTGFVSSEVLGETLDVLAISGMDGGFAAGLQRALSAGDRFHGEVHAQHANGSSYGLELEVTPVASGGEPATRWVALLRDCSQRMAQVAALEHQALYDFLTGLPNRALLHDRLGQAIFAAERDSTPVALFLMDLDGFKEVNDTFGHAMGDQLLKHLGPRIRGTLRTIDTVARLGGDEFAILLPAMGEKSGALGMARRILDAIEEPFEIDGHRVAISASIGIALCPRHGRDRTTLLRNADAAMYAAKRSAERYAVYADGGEAGR